MGNESDASFRVTRNAFRTAATLKKNTNSSTSGAAQALDVSGVNAEADDACGTSLRAGSCAFDTVSKLRRTTMQNSTIARARQRRCEGIVTRPPWAEVSL